jgi:hypothetical protein
MKGGRKRVFAKKHIAKSLSESGVKKIISEVGGQIGMIF